MRYFLYYVLSVSIAHGRFERVIFLIYFFLEGYLCSIAVRFIEEVAVWAFLQYQVTFLPLLAFGPWTLCLCCR
jgi:hypothetical protein